MVKTVPNGVLTSATSSTYPLGKELLCSSGLGVWEGYAPDMAIGCGLAR